MVHLKQFYDTGIFKKASRVFKHKIKKVYANVSGYIGKYSYQVKSKLEQMGDTWARQLDFIPF